MIVVLGAWRKVACIVLALAVLQGRNRLCDGNSTTAGLLDNAITSLNVDNVRLVSSKVWRASYHSVLGSVRVVPVRDLLPQKDLDRIFPDASTVVGPLYLWEGKDLWQGHWEFTITPSCQSHTSHHPINGRDCWGCGC
eukprot:jgi/Botrbrau1/9741/Bobra.0388s0030.1